MEQKKITATLKLLFDPDQCLLYGSFIRASRSILGLSQVEFAEVLGVTRTTLVRLENGIAPLKKSLCEAAVDLLKSVGIESEAMVQIRNGSEVPTTLDISVNYAEAQVKVKGLFGEGFVSPLKESPLRRK